MHAHTTTDKADFGGVESRDHRVSGLYQIQTSIGDAIRKIDITDTCHQVAVIDLQRAMERIESAINHIKSSA